MLSGMLTFSGCSTGPSKAELIAKDPYLPQLRADPMCAWSVDGADRQSPSETPYNPKSYGETKNSQIIISHALHAGIDIDSVLAKGEIAAKAAGYSESGYRVDPSGLRINCKVEAVRTTRTVLIVLTAPEG
jgi:hypothetical protein